MSDYFEGVRLARRIGVPCKDCQTASIWCPPCAAKWRKACDEQKRASPTPPQPVEPAPAKEPQR